jgi:hypothetical protein
VSRPAPPTTITAEIATNSTFSATELPARQATVLTARRGPNPK